MAKNIFYSLEEIEKFFVDTYNADIKDKKVIGKDTVFYMIHRKPLNKLPNWMWFAFKHYVKSSDGNLSYWRIWSPNDTHLNDLRSKGFDLFFKYYNADNKNKTLFSRKDGDYNVVKY